MNLRSLFFRDEQKAEVKEYEMFEVRWFAIRNRSNLGVNPWCGEYEKLKAFPSRNEADEFILALKDAFDITGCSDFKRFIKCKRI